MLQNFMYQMLKDSSPVAAKMSLVSFYMVTVMMYNVHVHVHVCN